MNICLKHRTIATAVFLGSFVLLMGPPRMAWASDTPSALARIELLENGRQTARSRWRPLVNHENPMVRMTALRGIGRVQAPSLVGLVESQLGHADKRVRAEAAFAYSQFPNVSAQVLLDRLEQERDEYVVIRLLQGIRFMAGPNDMGPLLKHVKSPSAQIRTNALLAIGDTLRRHRGQVSGLTPTPFVELWTDENPEVRFALAYVFSHYRALPEKHALYWAEKCARETDASVRRLCVRALSRYGTGGQALRLKALQDDDWRVRMAAVNVPARRGDEALLRTRVTALTNGLGTVPKGPEIHEWHHVIRSVLSLATLDDLRTNFETIYRTAQGWSTTKSPDQMALSSLACGAAAVLDRASNSNRRGQRCGAPSYPQSLRDAWIVRSLTSHPSKQGTARLIRAFKGLSTLGQIKALEILGRRPLTEKSKSLMTSALASKTPSVVGAAADACGTHGISSATQQLMDAYRLHYRAGHFTVVQSIFDALGKLGSESAQPILERHINDAQPGIRQAARRGATLIDRAVKRRLGQSGMRAAFVPGKRGLLPPPAETMAGETPDLNLIRPSPFKRATIQTNRGNIDIDLVGEEGRETVKNFVRLAKKGFYRGLTFHAVIPGFMVQGGDPDGTGWGGPGYSITCETGWQPFTRGSVGMALFGRDTGGSQFFFTHRAAPELDGRYTRFGQVVKGQDIVDALGVGDQILDVELHK
ncbi:MAG: peptidylprolyl isomerase [Myxococcota bacterium]|nr:peptidylprolyl isomerase [Myxococcota bacterium]